MRVARLAGVAVAVLAVSACVSSPGFIPLPSASENLKALGGEWRGEYTNPATGRRGNLYFALTPGEDAAAGEIVVYPHMGPGVVKWENRVTIASARYLAEVQTVRFVSYESGILTARVGPYVDANCGNVHVTTFFAEMRNGQLAGNFITRSDAHEPHTGQWTASRVR
jgi:hypothetical protein